MSRGLLGKDSPINMRQARRDALKEADLVILGGTVADFRLSYGRVLSKKSKIIAVNRNREQLKKNEGIFWQSELSVQGDAAKFFVSIANHLKGTYRVDEGWLSSLRARDVEKEGKAAKMAEDVPEEHLNPIDVSLA